MTVVKWSPENCKNLITCSDRCTMRFPCFAADPPARYYIPVAICARITLAKPITLWRPLLLVPRSELRFAGSLMVLPAQRFAFVRYSD